MIPEPVEAKASYRAVPAGSTTEGTVARGGTPSPPRGDGGDGSALPKMDGVKAPNSPSQVAATTAPGTPCGEAIQNVDAVPEEPFQRNKGFRMPSMN